MAGSVPPIWRQKDEQRFAKAFELSVEDHLAGRYGRGEALSFWPVAGFLTLCTAFVGLFLAFGWWQAGDKLWAVAIVAVSIAAGLLLARLAFGSLQSFFTGFWKGFLQKREMIGVPLEMTLDASGISILVRGETWIVPWDSLVTAEEDEERYYFWTSNVQGHVLPKSVFEADEREAFDRALEGWLGQKPVSPPRLAGRKHENWGQPQANPSGH